MTPDVHVDILERTIRSQKKRIERLEQIYVRARAAREIYGYPKLTWPSTLTGLFEAVDRFEAEEPKLSQR